MSPTTRIRIPRFLVATVFVAGVIVFLVVISLTSTTLAEASRTVVIDGDLYRASTVAGAYRLTNSKSIQILFDERGDDFLVGMGLEGGMADTDKVDGTKLYLIKKDSGASVSLTDDLVDRAFFDEHKPKVYFVTLAKELFSVDLTGNSSAVLLKEQVLDPSLSPDGKFMVYSKLNKDWMPGDYYDKALGLAILNLETLEERLITSSWEDFDPSWTPDGSRIIFLSSIDVQQPSTSQMVSLNNHKRIPDSEVTLTGERSTGKRPAVLNEAMPVTADGTTRNEVAMVVTPGIVDSYTTYFSIRSDGSEREQLTTPDELLDKDRKPPVPSSELSWSKDGKKFVYDSDGVIWIGSMSNDQKRLTAMKIGVGRDPKWVEDSTFISATALDTAAAVITMDASGKILK